MTKRLEKRQPAESVFENMCDNLRVQPGVEILQDAGLIKDVSL